MDHEIIGAPTNTKRKSEKQKEDYKRGGHPTPGQLQLNVLNTDKTID